MTWLESVPEFVRLKEYRLSDRFYPDVYRFPYRDATQQYYDQWCSGLAHLTPEGRKLYQTQGMASSIYYCYPHPVSCDAALACTINLIWNTLFDDYFGICEPEKLKRIRDRLIDIMQGARPSAEEHPLLRLVAEWRTRCEPLIPSHWFDRYVISVDDYIRKGLEPEVLFRRECRTPTFAELEQFRPYCIFMISWLRMVEVEIRCSLPEWIMVHPAIARIEYAIARATSWQNDAFSLMKETSRPREVGEIVNLALVLQQEHHLSLEDACAEMLRIHNEEVSKLTELVEALPDFGPLNTQVKEYVDHLLFAFGGLEAFYRNDGEARYGAQGCWVDEYA